ncbi:31822_t:CDS:2, partial [Racocetra persica]
KQSDKDFLLFSKFGVNEEAFDLRDPDSDYNILDNESTSSNTATGSFVIENVDEHDEIEPFMLDEIAFEKAKMLANKNEYNCDDEIEWDDLDYKSLETTTLTIESTESGHLFQRPGIGRHAEPCDEKHNDDTTLALELLG